MRLSEKGVAVLRSEDCLKFVKRDEGRLAFFRSLESFLSDLKKAQTFNIARRAKAKRQAEMNLSSQSRYAPEDLDAESPRR